MLTIISFILMIAGCVNWLMIGLLQYDFVAGIFGYQGSVFSRIIYIIVGAACLFFVFKVIKGKGSVSIFSRRNKEDLANNLKMQKAKVSNNVEASQEAMPQENHTNSSTSQFDKEQDVLHAASTNSHVENAKEQGLFNEHFQEK